MTSHEDDLGEGGRALWTALHPPGVDRDPATDVLIKEACRIADRLDGLEAILSGRTDSWVTLGDEVHGRIELVVDKVLTEARQQAATLRALLAPLTKAIEAATPAEGADPADDLADARARRRAEAATS